MCGRRREKQEQHVRLEGIVGKRVVRQGGREDKGDKSQRAKKTKTKSFQQFHDRLKARKATTNKSKSNQEK